MQTESVGSTGSDPLKAVADALDTAVKATKDGAEKRERRPRTPCPPPESF